MRKLEKDWDTVVVSCQACGAIWDSSAVYFNNRKELEEGAEAFLEEIEKEIPDRIESGTNACSCAHLMWHR